MWLKKEKEIRGTPPTIKISSSRFAAQKSAIGGTILRKFSSSTRLRNQKRTDCSTLEYSKRCCGNRPNSVDNRRLGLMFGNENILYRVIRKSLSRPRSACDDQGAFCLPLSTHLHTNANSCSLYGKPSWRTVKIAALTTYRISLTIQIY